MRPNSDRLWLIMVVLLGLAARGLFLVAGGYVIDSDEAIVGLMAKHIQEGKSFPIFYYGQPYMGSLEPILTAVGFNLFGRGPVTLKLVPLLCSLWLITVTYGLALRYTDRIGARFAALFIALPPLALMEWGTKARGGFIELVLLGSMALTIATDILQGRRVGSLPFAYLGFLLGVAWWVNNQAIFYMAPIGVVFLFAIPWRFGFRASLGFLTWSIGSFLFGSLPFWLFNLVEIPRFATFKMLGGGVSYEDALKSLGNVFAESLPILLGARRFWTREDLFLYSSTIALTVFAAVTIFLLAQQRKREGGWALLLMFNLFLGLIFCTSRFGWLTEAPRYLLPLYSVFPVAFGALVGSCFRYLRPVALFLLVAQFGLNLASNYLWEIAVPGQPFVYGEERAASDHGELYRWLAQRGIRHLNTNYWIGYRVAFETDEQVTFSVYGDPRTVRIPEYEWQSDGDEHYLLTPEHAFHFLAGLEELGYSYRVSEVGSYRFVDHIVPIVSAGSPIPLQPEWIKVKDRPSWAKNLVDGDDGTRWGSGRPRAPDMEIEVAFPKAEKVASIALIEGFWPQDATDSLEIEVEGPGGRCVVFDGSTHDVLLGRENSFQVYFEPRDVQRIFLRNRGRSPIFDWSIAELLVFGPSDDDN